MFLLTIDEHILKTFQSLMTGGLHDNVTNARMLYEFFFSNSNIYSLMRI